MSEEKKKRAFVQLAESEVNKTDGWLLNGKEVVPFSKLTPSQLQKALTESEEKELRHYNRSSFFGILADKILGEAETRGITLKHINTEFSQKTHDKTAQKEGNPD